MTEKVFKARIGHGERASTSPLGFWLGLYRATVSLFDEPGNRELFAAPPQSAGPVCLRLSWKPTVQPNDDRMRDGRSNCA